jgi:hypothetical protein
LYITYGFGRPSFNLSHASRFLVAECRQWQLASQAQRDVLRCAQRQILQPFPTRSQVTNRFEDCPHLGGILIANHSRKLPFQRRDFERLFEIFVEQSGKNAPSLPNGADLVWEPQFASQEGTRHDVVAGTSLSAKNNARA